jgi:hypothetical protein
MQIYASVGSGAGEQLYAGCLYTGGEPPNCSEVETCAASDTEPCAHFPNSCLPRGWVTLDCGLSACAP